MDRSLEQADPEVGMKGQTIAGLVLIVVGVLALALGSISYTKEETVLDIGPLEATARTRESIPLPPLLGGLALAGGVALVFMGRKKGSV
jgi:hypothetical protein